MTGSPTTNGVTNSHTVLEAQDEIMQEDEAPQKTKKGRGPTRGLGLHKINRRFDKKLSVTIDPDFGRALTRAESSSFANELGQIAQAYLWPISKTESKNEILPLILLRLQGRRGRLHETFNKHVTDGLNPKELKPNNVHEDTWNQLCDYWNDDDVQGICEKNKTNRSLLTKPHNQGSVAFIPLFHETLKEEGSENFNWIEFFKRTRTTKSGDWTTRDCEQAYCR
ncbi:hypothetical protein LINGRAHAP2_LOCUS20324 [Linum grandiflorum]